MCAGAMCAAFAWAVLAGAAFPTDVCAACEGTHPSLPVHPHPVPSGSLSPFAATAECLQTGGFEAQAAEGVHADLRGGRSTQPVRQTVCSELRSS